MKKCATAVAIGLVVAGVCWLSTCGYPLINPRSAQAGEAARAPWNFVVLSDIHVSPNGKVATTFRQLVTEVTRLKPRLVIINGDSTNGNEDDHHTIERVRSWWKALEHALAPLRLARIPVFAIAGNHDSYRPVHRQGYEEAWKTLADDVAPITLSGQPPQNYSFDLDGVHFSLLHVVDQSVEAPVKAWLKQDLATSQAATARLRFAFGHVPLKSAMGKSRARFALSLGSELLKGRVNAYIAGHEHLFWDETLKIDGQPLRQLTVGTASGTYNFPLNDESYTTQCQGALCQLPGSKQSFALVPGTRRQKSKVTLLMVTVNPDGYGTRFMALDQAGKLGPIAD